MFDGGFLMRMIKSKFVSIAMIVTIFMFLLSPAISVRAMSGDSTVYVTRTGDCYHRDGCSSLSRSQIPISLSEALSKGYYACSRCNPGGLDAAPVTQTALAQTPAKTTVQAQAPATASVVTQVPVTQTTTSGWDCIYNETYYRTNNPDVDKAYIGDSKGIFDHFKTSGMKEGRRGSEEFDVTSYRTKNADLNAAFGDDLPKYYYHYMNTGKAEGRSGK